MGKFQLMFALQLLRCPSLNPRIRGITLLSEIIDLTVRSGVRWAPLLPSIVLCYALFSLLGMQLPMGSASYIPAAQEYSTSQNYRLFCFHNLSTSPFLFVLYSSSSEGLWRRRLRIMFMLYMSLLFLYLILNTRIAFFPEMTCGIFAEFFSGWDSVFLIYRFFLRT